MTSPQDSHFEYDVAISFAGEDRAIAQRLYDLLSSRGVRVFYDRNEQADLWGKDLGERLPDIYLNRARYCLMLISAHYLQKDWTTLERKIAQARAIRQREEYILPVKLDDTPVPDFLRTVVYVDAKVKTPEEIVELVLQKLSVVGQAQVSPVHAAATRQQFQIPVPVIPRKRTQLDKDQFIERAFEVVKEYFRQGLNAIQSNYPNLTTDFKEIDSQKFVARIYVGGELKCQCKIWTGSAHSQDILYVEGNHIDIRHDNSYNDILSVEDTGSDLAIRLSEMGFFHERPAQNPTSPEQAAEYLWKRFTSPLKHL